MCVWHRKFCVQHDFPVYLLHSLEGTLPGAALERNLQSLLDKGALMAPTLLTCKLVTCMLIYLEIFHCLSWHVNWSDCMSLSRGILTRYKEWLIALLYSNWLKEIFSCRPLVWHRCDTKCLGFVMSCSQWLFLYIHDGRVLLHHLYAQK